MGKRGSLGRGSRSHPAICIASQLGGSHRFLGYDNFWMIPAPLAIDGERPNQRYRIIQSGQSKGIGGEAYYGYRSNLLEAVTENYARFGAPVDGARIRLVKGSYEETLVASDYFPIAFAHIDCDWYESVCLSLDHVYKRLQPGGL